MSSHRRTIPFQHHTTRPLGDLLEAVLALDSTTLTLQSTPVVGALGGHRLQARVRDNVTDATITLHLRASNHVLATVQAECVESADGVQIRGKAAVGAFRYVFPKLMFVFFLFGIVQIEFYELLGRDYRPHGLPWQLSVPLQVGMFAFIGHDHEVARSARKQLLALFIGLLSPSEAAD